jgi:hypothetical protein
MSAGKLRAAIFAEIDKMNSRVSEKSSIESFQSIGDGCVDVIAGYVAHISCKHVDGWMDFYLNKRGFSSISKAHCLFQAMISTTDVHVTFQRVISSVAKKNCLRAFAEDNKKK